MDTEHTVSQAAQEETESPVKTTLRAPAALWREVKKAAIDKGKTAEQFVIETLAEKVGYKHAA